MLTAAVPPPCCFPPRAADAPAGPGASLASLASMVGPAVAGAPRERWHQWVLPLGCVGHALTQLASGYSLEAMRLFQWDRCAYCLALALQQVGLLVRGGLGW
jgi:hypothetical protein